MSHKAVHDKNPFLCSRMILYYGLIVNPNIRKKFAYTTDTRNGKIEDIGRVVEKTQASQKLSVKNIDNRGWLMDTLMCVNSLKFDTFTLDDMYEFAEILAVKHPQNNNVKPKIRQQLQMLRDKGVIEFVRRGQYRKVRE